MIVELDTPKHLDTELFFENIGKLDEAHIDAVTLADNSRYCKNQQYRCCKFNQTTI